MARLSTRVVWAEMARRKLRFHHDKNWQSIELWGLFSWGAVSHLLKTGELITHMRKEHRIVWVRPSAEAYEQHIKPLLEKHTLEELTTMAGW